MSANVSYQHASDDVELFTGIRVPAKTHDRLVHAQTFCEPTVEPTVEALSVDGGFPSDSHAFGRTVQLAGVQRGVSAFLRGLSPPRFKRIPGWSIGSMLNPSTPRLLAIVMVMMVCGTSSPRSHPMGIGRKFSTGSIWPLNLHKVGGSVQRLHQAEAFLWQGQVDEAKALFANWDAKQVQNFCHYQR